MSLCFAPCINALGKVATYLPITSGIPVLLKQIIVLDSSCMSDVAPERVSIQSKSYSCTSLLGVAADEAFSAFSIHAWMLGCRIYIRGFLELSVEQSIIRHRELFTLQIHFAWPAPHILGYWSDWVAHWVRGVAFVLQRFTIWRNPRPSSLRFYSHSTIVRKQRNVNTYQCQNTTQRPLHQIVLQNLHPNQINRHQPPKLPGLVGSGGKKNKSIIVQNWTLRVGFYTKSGCALSF